MVTFSVPVHSGAEPVSFRVRPYSVAFAERARRFSIGDAFAITVVPSGLSPVWLVRRSSLLVLLPDDPETGALRAATPIKSVRRRRRHVDRSAPDRRRNLR